MMMISGQNRQSRIKIACTGLILLLMALGSLNVPVIRADTTTTPTGNCTKREMGQVVVGGTVYFAPDEGSSLRFDLQPGTTFYVCTDIIVPGYYAFLLSTNGNVLYVKAGVFANINGLGAGAAPQAPLPPSGTEQAAPADSTTAMTTAAEGDAVFTKKGNCSTGTVHTVATEAKVYYEPTENAFTGLTLQAGSSFYVCDDILSPSWSAFQFMKGNTIYYVKSGTFIG
jgi:hypothetical protein